MPTAESSNSLLRVGIGALVRAAFVLFGTTITAWWLGSRIEDGLAAAGDSPGAQNPIPGVTDRWSGYWAAFGDALTPTPATSETLGRTMMLAAAAIAIGLAVGFLFGLLMRVPKLGPVLGFLTLPAMALAIPGVALYPLARAVNSLGWADAGPPEVGTPLGDGLGFIALWGLVAGLAVAPSVAAEVARSSAATMVGPQTARSWSAVRSDAGLGPRFGLPTTAFILALATAEILSGHRGALARFFESLQRRSLDETFEITFWLAFAGAVLTITIAVASYYLGGDASAAENPLRPSGTSRFTATSSLTRTSRSLLMPLVVVLTLLVAVALAGSFANPTGRDAAAILDNPTFGGPWLGTDAVGRGLAHLSAVGLWPAVVAGVVPAVVATFLGAIIALVVTSAPRAISRALDVMTDLVWWPTAVVLPLAFLALGNGGRLGLSWEFLVFTGLALTPLAARLTTSNIAAEQGRLGSLFASTLFFSAGVAVSIHTLLGFSGFGGGDERPQLGTAIRAGLETYDSSIWPYLVPTAAASLLAAVLYGLSASLIVPVAAPTSTVEGASDTSVWDSDPAPAQPVEPDATDGGWQNNQTTQAELPALRNDELDSHPERDPEQAPLQEPEQEPEKGDLPDLPDPEKSPAIATAVDETSRYDITEDTGDTGDTEDEMTILDAATRTIELRPSKLRKAGFISEEPVPKQTAITATWLKPDLAPRPSPVDTDHDASGDPVHEPAHESVQKPVQDEDE